MTRHCTCWPTLWSLAFRAVGPRTDPERAHRVSLLFVATPLILLLIPLLLLEQLWGAFGRVLRRQGCGPEGPLWPAQPAPPPVEEPEALEFIEPEPLITRGICVWSGPRAPLIIEDDDAQPAARAEEGAPAPRRRVWMDDAGPRDDGIEGPEDGFYVS